MQDYVYVGIWCTIFTFAIIGVTFFFFAVAGEVAWGYCPDVTRAPENIWWGPEYKSPSEKPLCAAPPWERWVCAAGSVSMILVAAVMLRVMASLHL